MKLLLGIFSLEILLSFGETAAGVSGETAGSFLTDGNNAGLLKNYSGSFPTNDTAGAFFSSGFFFARGCHCWSVR